MNAVKRRKMQKREFIFKKIQENKKTVLVEKEPVVEEVKVEQPTAVEEVKQETVEETKVEEVVAEVKSTKKKKTV